MKKFINILFRIGCYIVHTDNPELPGLPFGPGGPSNPEGP